MVMRSVSVRLTKFNLFTCQLQQWELCKRPVSPSPVTCRGWKTTHHISSCESYEVRQLFESREQTSALWADWGQSGQSARLPRLLVCLEKQLTAHDCSFSGSQCCGLNKQRPHSSCSCSQAPGSPSQQQLHWSETWLSSSLTSLKLERGQGVTYRSCPNSCLQTC